MTTVPDEAITMNYKKKPYGPSKENRNNFRPHYTYFLKIVFSHFTIHTSLVAGNIHTNQDKKNALYLNVKVFSILARKD